jgi:hypothetical protein
MDGVSSMGGRIDELSLSVGGRKTSSLFVQAKMGVSRDRESAKAAIDFNFFIITSRVCPAPKRKGGEGVFLAKSKIGIL